MLRGRPIMHTLFDVGQLRVQQGLVDVLARSCRQRLSSLADAFGAQDGSTEYKRYGDFLRASVNSALVVAGNG